MKEALAAERQKQAPFVFTGLPIETQCETKRAIDRTDKFELDTAAGMDSAPGQLRAC